MNERIKQLAEQAGFETNGANVSFGNYIQYKEYFYADDFIEDELKKFAELIVRECAQAFEAEVDTWKEMDPYQGSIKRQGAKAIKQHFGVEE